MLALELLGAVSAPISRTNATTALAPSETDITTKISARMSLGPSTGPGSREDCVCMCAD